MTLGDITQMTILSRIKKFLFWWVPNGKTSLKETNTSPKRKKRKYRIRRIGDQYKIEYWNGTTWVYLKSGFDSLSTAEAWLDRMTTADFQDSVEKAHEVD